MCLMNYKGQSFSVLLVNQHALLVNQHALGLLQLTQRIVYIN